MPSCCAAHGGFEAGHAREGLVLGEVGGPIISGIIVGDAEDLRAGGNDLLLVAARSWYGASARESTVFYTKVHFAVSGLPLASGEAASGRRWSGWSAHKVMGAGKFCK